jgi:hypothetical protein
MDAEFDRCDIGIKNSSWGVHHIAEFANHTRAIHKDLAPDIKDRLAFLPGPLHRLSLAVHSPPLEVVSILEGETRHARRARCDGFIEQKTLQVQAPTKLVRKEEVTSATVDLCKIPDFLEEDGCLAPLVELFDAHLIPDCLCSVFITTSGLLPDEELHIGKWARSKREQASLHSFRSPILCFCDSFGLHPAKSSHQLRSACKVEVPGKRTGNATNGVVLGTTLKHQQRDFEAFAMFAGLALSSSLGRSSHAEMVRLKSAVSVGNFNLAHTISTLESDEAKPFFGFRVRTQDFVDDFKAAAFVAFFANDVELLLADFASVDDGVSPGHAKLDRDENHGIGGGRHLTNFESALERPPGEPMLEHSWM